MLYNKNKVSKINDKKILHKVGKKWVVMSVAVLGLLGGGALATSGSAHHVAMPNVGVVAHAHSNTSDISNYDYSGYHADYANHAGQSNTVTQKQTVNLPDPNNTAIKDVYNANGDGATATINSSNSNHDDGTSVTLNDDAGHNDADNNSTDMMEHSKPNYVIRLAKRDHDTVNFVNNGSVISTTNYSGADGASHTFQINELPENYQMMNPNIPDTFTYDNGTHNVNVRANQYKADIYFKGAAANNSHSNMDYYGDLILDYTGSNEPGNINLNKNSLMNLAANNLAIDPASTLVNPNTNPNVVDQSGNQGNNPVYNFEPVKTQAALDDFLKGYNVSGQVADFDYNTTNDDKFTGRRNANPLTLTQDYDALVTFVDVEPGSKGNQVVEAPEVVDFGANNPLHNNNNYTFNDAMHDGKVSLPKGYSLASGTNVDWDSTPDSTNHIYDNQPLDSNDMSNQNGPDNSSDIVYVKHDASTSANDWKANIQYVDEYGHKIGSVHPVDTGLSVHTNADGDPDNVPNTEIGEPATYNAPATGLFADGQLSTPNGYVVDTGSDSKSQNNYDKATSVPDYEDYNDPATTYVQLDPAYEANITLKDAVTGNIIKSSTPVTFANTNSSLTPYPATLPSPRTVSDMNTQNILGVPDGYVLAGYDYTENGVNFYNNANNANGNATTGLEKDDVLPMNDPTDLADSNSSKGVPNDVVLVTKQNPSVDYAAIQFVSKGRNLGNPVVVSANTDYNSSHNINNPSSPTVDDGVDLGAFLNAHQGIVPAGYQVSPDNLSSQKVNYQTSEHPTAVTDVNVKPKASNTYEAAIQFMTPTGQDVGMPVMVNTNATSDTSFNQDLGDDDRSTTSGGDNTGNSNPNHNDSNANSVRLGSFLDAYGIQVPEGYKIASTPNQDDSLVKLAKLQGADGTNNLTGVHVVPVDPSYNSYNAGASNAGNNSNIPDGPSHNVSPNQPDNNGNNNQPNNPNNNNNHNGNNNHGNHNHNNNNSNAAHAAHIAHLLHLLHLLSNMGF